MAIDNPAIIIYMSMRAFFRSMPHSYSYRTTRIIDSIKKLSLNLLTLALLGLILWSGIELFSRYSFIGSQTVSSIIFIGEIMLFVLLAKLTYENTDRPGMILTVLVLIAVFFIFAFAGVRPFSVYKDSIFSGVATFFKFG